jgi:hypothetical protein
MSRTFLIAVAFLFIPVGALLAQDEPSESEDTSAGLPKEYADYLIASSTLSPDKKFAVIYPKAKLCPDKRKTGSADRCKDYLVALQPFAVLTTLETKSPEFQNKNHGGISASWSEDGAAVLVTLDAKWGPEDVFLFEIGDGKVSRSTNLLQQVHDLFLPDYKAAKVGPVGEFAFLVENPEEGDFCEFADSNQVRIHAMATTDPKETPGRKAWDATLEAVWDISEARFASQEVKRTFAGVRKEVEDE